MDALRTRIEEGIRDGSLPATDCLVTWYGRGRGQVCVVCSQRILGSDVAIDCDLPGGTTAWFHAPCYELWRAVIGR
jgi:hypothetical protein